MLEKKSYPIRINNRQILLLLSLLIIPLASAELGGETITLKTYYPSPYGSYQKMKITKLLTAGSATDALLIDGRVVIGSGNTTLPLSYGNAKKTENVQVDVNGSQAVNDLWLKSVGKWASDSAVIKIETAGAFRYKKTALVIKKGPADCCTSISAKAWDSSAELLYGIQCNRATGWIRTSCTNATDGYDNDLAIADNACLSEDLNAGEDTSLGIACVRFLVNDTPIIPN
ncbi:MAG: hypothetical protein WCS77_08285 [Elusimicrobiaceae bacterium]